jgi:tRNA (adenine57-N1/adenine58-N1)-methyltransferase catalytic subunit
MLLPFLLLMLQSIIIFRLNMKPGDVVIESGTGSGAMSTAILRTIAPHGHLHTFEFNKLRATIAAAEFASNGLDKLVTVKHSDVCAEGFGAALNGKVDAVCCASAFTMLE